MSSIDPPPKSAAQAPKVCKPGSFRSVSHSCLTTVTLTETTVAIVDHEVGSQGSGGEVVHAAGAVRHVPHHDGVGVCEPGKHKAEA